MKLRLLVLLFPFFFPRRWGFVLRGRVQAHIKSSLIGASVGILITDGELGRGFGFLEFRDGRW